MLPPFRPVVFPTLRPCSVGIPHGSLQLLAAVAVIVFEVQSRKRFGKRPLNRHFFVGRYFVDNADVFHFEVPNVA